ncbi:hypothetical protein M9458_002591, partial [Cirrhinus mrigala]
APPSDSLADLDRSLCLTGIHSLPVVVRSIRGPPLYQCTGTQLAEGPVQICISPSEPHCTDPVQSQGGQRTGSSGGPVLAQQNLVLGPCAPIVNPSLAHSSEKGPPFSGERHNLAPAPRSLELPPMFPGCDQEDFRHLPSAVVNTLLQTRAPSTRTHEDVASNLCYPSSKEAWIGTCLLQHSRSMWQLYQPIMTWWKADR